MLRCESGLGVEKQVGTMPGEQYETKRKRMGIVTLSRILSEQLAWRRWRL